MLKAAAETLGKWYVDKVKQGVTKFKEAVDPSTQLSKEEFLRQIQPVSNTSRALLKPFIHSILGHTIPSIPYCDDGV